tara:strand:- start:34523 stop:35011 length:489 start_codon:yes stop_codon:yes gene_type:complete
MDKTILFKQVHPDAKLPTKTHSGAGIGDTGYDVYAVENVVIDPGKSAVVDVGIELAYMPPGYWIRIEGRSGLGFVKGIWPHPGIIDNQYRGNMGVKLYNLNKPSADDWDGVYGTSTMKEAYEVKAGDRIAQLVVYKLHELDVAFGASVESERGEKGFGSSGT